MTCTCDPTECLCASRRSTSSGTGATPIEEDGDGSVPIGGLQQLAQCKRILRAAAAAELGSTHPLAQAILDCAGAVVDTQGIAAGKFMSKPGYGVRC